MKYLCCMGLGAHELFLIGCPAGDDDDTDDTETECDEYFWGCSG